MSKIFYYSKTRVKYYFWVYCELVCWILYDDFYVFQSIKLGVLKTDIQETNKSMIKLKALDLDNMLVYEGCALVYQGHKTVGLENQLADLRKDRQVKIESQPN